MDGCTCVCLSTSVFACVCISVRMYVGMHSCMHVCINRSAGAMSLAEGR